MSNKGKLEVSCPHCKHRFEADFWTVVRGDRDTELKEMIVSGEFDLLLCPACSRVFAHEETFIYIDPVMELLVFVMPQSYMAEKDKWIAKMDGDFQAVSSGISGLPRLNFKPRYAFGLDFLTELLLHDRDIEEETEVMAFIARDLGLETARLAPEFSRSKGLTFGSPFEKGSRGRDSAVSALRKIVERNPAMPRVKSLLSYLENPHNPDFPVLDK